MNATLVFQKMKSALTPYESKMELVTDNETTYYLNYPSEGKDAKPEMFAAVMVKKNYVSMYYMPVYNQPDLLDGISPELKKRMQGKSCFNFTDENDPAIDELKLLIERSA